MNLKPPLTVARAKVLEILIQMRADVCKANGEQMTPLRPGRAMYLMDLNYYPSGDDKEYVPNVGLEAISNNILFRTLVRAFWCVPQNTAVVLKAATLKPSGSSKLHPVPALHGVDVY